MKIKHLFGLALLMILLGAGCAVETLTQDSGDVQDAVQEDATKYAPNPYMDATKVCYVNTGYKYVDMAVMIHPSNPDVCLLRDNGDIEFRSVSNANTISHTVTGRSYKNIDYVDPVWAFVGVDDNDRIVVNAVYGMRNELSFSYAYSGVNNICGVAAKAISSNKLEVYVLVPSGSSEYIRKITVEYPNGSSTASVTLDSASYSFNGMYGNGITEMEGKLWGQVNYYTSKFFKQTSISSSDRTFEVLPSGYTHHGFWNFGEKETFTLKAYDYETYGNKLYGIHYLGSSTYAVAYLPYSNINF